MARPQKNSCDYFTHDNDMRNHRKVKSIRNKFGIQGYAVWSMLLEYLTGIDGNEFEYSDLEFELISGDFGVSVTEIREVVDYCIKLEMLFTNNGFVYSESLNNRLAPVYKKRGIAKEISEKQKRIKGKFINNTVDTVVSVTETPQSKVKEIKEEESKVNNTEFSDENLNTQFQKENLELTKKLEELTKALDEEKKKKERKSSAKKKEEVDEQKMPHGEHQNVFLLDSEVDKLIQNNGLDICNMAVDKLSNYKLSSGKSYKSDYGAINQWVLDSVRKTLNESVIQKNIIQKTEKNDSQHRKTETSEDYLKRVGSGLDKIFDIRFGRNGNQSTRTTEDVGINYTEYAIAE